MNQFDFCMYIPTYFVAIISNIDVLQNQTCWHLKTCGYKRVLALAVLHPFSEVEDMVQWTFENYVKFAGFIT